MELTDELISLFEEAKLNARINRKKGKMDTVTVDKAELLKTIRENRENHRQVFNDAVEVYREKMIAELDSMLEDAKAGRKIRRAISMPEPEDHTRDYDRVIKMLEMSVDSQIEIEEQEFNWYVMDQWQWNASFNTSTVAYAAQNVKRQ